jgi:hypothetical protein
VCESQLHTLIKNGDRKKVERPARLKKWWVKDNAGIIILRVLYGSKAIELQKGKAAVEVGQLDKLPAVLKTIKDAVLAGELDAEIGLISGDGCCCIRLFCPEAGLDAPATVSSLELNSPFFLLGVSLLHTSNQCSNQGRLIHGA